MVQPTNSLGGRQLLVSSVLWPEAIRDAPRFVQANGFQTFLLGSHKSHFGAQAA